VRKAERGASTQAEDDCTFEETEILQGKEAKWQKKADRFKARENAGGAFVKGTKGALSPHSKKALFALSDESDAVEAHPAVAAPIVRRHKLDIVEVAHAVAAAP
jgi:hypothetical protein